MAIEVTNEEIEMPEYGKRKYHCYPLDENGRKWAIKDATQSDEKSIIAKGNYTDMSFRC